MKMGILFSTAVTFFDLAAKIRQLLDSNDKGAGLGEKARKGVLRWHTWKHNAERIIGRAEALMSSGV